MAKKAKAVDPNKKQRAAVLKTVLKSVIPSSLGRPRKIATLKGKESNKSVLKLLKRVKAAKAAKK